jgi:hypothetical protein
MTPFRRPIAVLVALLGAGAGLLVTGPPAAAAGPVRPICFPVIEPVNYTDDFGAPRDGHTHEGNDLLGKKMYKIVSPANGTIVDIRGPGSGTTAYALRIRDDEGWYFTFLHINNDTPGTDDGMATVDQVFAPGLAVGQRVWAGQFLAFMGDSGNAEEVSAHLHFEMRQPAANVWSSVAVDPYDSLQAATHCPLRRRAAHDRDGDGISDLVVVRPPATGGASPQSPDADQWFWWQSTAGYRVDTGGSPADVVIAADYDGDRRDDVIRWRPGTPSVFTVQLSSTGQTVTQAWGTTGDDPTVVGDYDGDGRADLAIYRPGHPSTWWILYGNGRWTTTQWGETGDVAAPADYDGDGRTDIAVRRSDGVTTWFWINASTAGFRLVHFGEVADRVVPGDFDGDGAADVAVTRQINGVIVWFALVGQRMTTTTFGEAATDHEIVGDYDGDGRSDVAVWRATSPGRFYVLQSSSGRMTSLDWGEPTDTAIAGFNVR